MPDEINIKILVAPLDWGLGHATRCVPIINQLLKSGCKVIIAAEGAQQLLLKREFPDLIFVSLPGYRIKYSNNKRLFAIKILLQLPKILISIQRERKWLANFILQTPVDAVISDNRYGLNHSNIKSIFITHQLLIKAPLKFAETIMQKMNFRFIKKFNECWIPDEEGKINMAGVLSHPHKLPKFPLRYLGGLSRLAKQPDGQRKFNILIIISGPEPQRTLLEKKLLNELFSFSGSVYFVRGLPADAETLHVKETVQVVNHLPAKQLEEAYNLSELIISRSGYSTVMDICKLQKKSVLIPTPGQTEQEYLAKHLEKQGWCVAALQDKFSLKDVLKRAEIFNYKLPNLDMDFYKTVVDDFVHKMRR